MDEIQGAHHTRRSGGVLRSLAADMEAFSGIGMILHPPGVRKGIAGFRLAVFDEIFLAPDRRFRE